MASVHAGDCVSRARGSARRTSSHSSLGAGLALRASSIPIGSAVSLIVCILTRPTRLDHASEWPRRQDRADQGDPARTVESEARWASEILLTSPQALVPGLRGSGSRAFLERSSQSSHV